MYTSFSSDQSISYAVFHTGSKNEQNMGAFELDVEEMEDGHSCPSIPLYHI